MAARTALRKRGAAAIETARPYARRVRDDRTLRRHALNALESSDRAAARLRGGGAREAVRRAAADETARREIRRAVDELVQARGRLEKSTSHRRRNTLFVVGGLGATLLAPKVRGWFGGMAEGGSGSFATTIEEAITVEVPVTTAYNQWTQFEDFPSFMQGVERVEQVDDTHLRWAARVAGKRHEWEATITEQEPDHRISWAATGGKGNSGTVMFRSLGPNSTEVAISMSYPPRGVAEKVGARLGLDRRRVRGDLGRFKALIESQGTETGAWRGRIEGGSTTRPA